jgi:murein DD-endopeptidase MepM/ murein hydrolase activator NlpD
MLVRAAAALIAMLALAPAATAAVGDADVAALQVALRARGFYSGPINGIIGPQTSDALGKLSPRAPGASVNDARAALGAYGRYTLGSRTLRPGLAGWDVAAFQFLLAWQGFPSGPFNGSYSARTATAVRSFQTSVGLSADGIAGPVTIAAVRRPPPRSPRRLAPPVALAPSGFFGPRHDRFHAGIDYPAPAGTAVRAAAGGRVTFAGWDVGGYGFLVTIDHGGGLQTMYAHLARVAVRVGETVRSGAVVARSGASGLSSGPHLHFELRLRAAALDPLPALSQLY